MDFLKRNNMRMLLELVKEGELDAVKVLELALLYHNNDIAGRILDEALVDELNS
tara:strand:- start:5696 stop:5857 length:162 start_codon:yes stop_codon:yes gene_type:complete